jgi:hypothetical protein
MACKSAGKQGKRTIGGLAQNHFPEEHFRWTDITRLIVNRSQQQLVEVQEDRPNEN